MTQPTALFLADILEDAGKPADIAEKCAAELRRLYAENEALQKTKHYEASLWRLRWINADLLEALKLSRAQWIHSVNSDHCLAAIKAAEENT